MSAVYVSLLMGNISRRGQRIKSFEPGISNARKSNVNSLDTNKMFIPSMSLAMGFVLPPDLEIEQPDYGTWKQVKIY
jgi:hypothetical protein